MYLIGVAILLIVIFIFLQQKEELSYEDDAIEFLVIHALGVEISLTSWIGLFVIALYYLAKFISNKIKPKGN